jgi:hypothetical protein
VVLVYSFTALYTSLLTVSIYKPTVSSINDVAARQMRVYTLKGITEEYILNSKNGSLKFIGDQLRSNPRQSIDIINIEKVPNLISSKSVFVVVSF